MSAKPNRVALPGSERTLPPGAQRLAPANPDELIQLTVRIKRREDPHTFSAAAELDQRLPVQRNYLTREEFAARHGCHPEDLAAIRKFAVENNLQVASVAPARRTVMLSGTVAAFNQALGSETHHYSYSGCTYRCRIGPLQIPAELENVVEGIFGLDNRPQAHPHFRRRIRALATDVSFTPLQLAQAYQFPAGADGTGQSIAIIELGGGYTAADLDQYFKSLGLKTPTVTTISVDGGKNAPNNGDGADGEVELDIEVAGAIAPGAKLGVYFAPNTDQGFIDAITTAAHDANLRPSIISISWGGPENTWTQQARNSLNTACLDASIMGVTILVACGDNGATDSTQGSTLTVDFPSSSPYVLGCGGTKLALTGTTIRSEQVWNEIAHGEGATGGGVSQLFPLPSYQNAANVPAAPNGFRGRGVPDIAADADPASGFQVLVDGQSTVIGGTSAVAPLWAGLLARINQLQGKPSGYLNPILYSPTVAATFRDITSGNNAGYSAAPGWDPCTGLGTPNGELLLAALKGSTTAK